MTCFKIKKHTNSIVKILLLVLFLVSLVNANEAVNRVPTVNIILLDDKAVGIPQGIDLIGTLP